MVSCSVGVSWGQHNECRMASGGVVKILTVVSHRYADFCDSCPLFAVG